MTIDNSAKNILKVLKAMQTQIDTIEEDVNGLIGSRVAIHEEQLDALNKLDTLNNKFNALNKKVK